MSQLRSLFLLMPAHLQKRRQTKRYVVLCHAAFWPSVFIKYGPPQSDIGLRGRKLKGIWISLRLIVFCGYFFVYDLFS